MGVKLIITDLILNNEIRDKQVRLVDSDGAQLGIVELKEAFKIADERNLDLVKISTSTTPPVCKIMDYSKYRFTKSKKEKEAKKKQKVVEIKEIRLSPNIDEHDINVKLKKALQFLKNGSKVKVTIRFRGRELAHTNLDLKIFDKIVEETSEYGFVEKKPKMESKSMSMFLAPTKN